MQVDGSRWKLWKWNLPMEASTIPRPASLEASGRVGSGKFHNSYVSFTMYFHLLPRWKHVFLLLSWKKK